MGLLHLNKKIKDWTPDINDISERLVMGPQRDCLTKVNRINTRYGLSLGITKTYRWSPGYMDQIKDYMLNKYLEPHMKRKMSTYFNQIDNKQWNYRSLRDSCNELDNKLASMRRNRQRFQDNSEVCERVLEGFLKKVNQQVEQFGDHVQVYYCKYMNDRETYYTNDLEMITFEFRLPDTNMHYYIGNKSYAVPINEAVLYYSLPLDVLLYKLTSSIEWLEDDTKPMLGFSNISYGDTLRNDFTDQWKGYYNREYINEHNDNLTSSRYSNHNQLCHPFISKDEFSGSFSKIFDEENNYTRTIAYSCLGDHLTSITQKMNHCKLGDVYAMLFNWHTVFDSVNTRPMNAFKYLFWGRHKNMDETFNNVIPVTADNCALNTSNRNNPGSTTYCDSIDCLNKTKCDYYKLSNMSEEESLASIADALIDNERDDGGEVADRDGEAWDPMFEEINDSDNSDIGNDELTIEEQTIMWAAQRGGALNIERNENG